MPAPSTSSGSPSTEDDRNESVYYDQMAALELSPQLESQVSTILQMKDPLDAPQFDPTEYINRLFPNEQAMASMDNVLGVLQSKLDHLGIEIKQLTSEQLNTRQDNAEDLKKARQAIEELFVKIQDIKKKAAQSEEMVQEITQDIKSLDYAKRHLTLSITALKRLQMLVTAVSQLDLMIQKRQYKDSAQLLQAVLQLLQHFKTYKSIPQVAELSKSISALKADLNERSLKEFKSAFNGDGAITGYTSVLHDVCLVVSVLGPESVNALTDWYVELQLKSYRALFRPGFEVSDLDNISRRYAWLKRMLNTCEEEQGSIFPPEWRISEKLCHRFCKYTSDDLKEVLAKKQPQIDVKELLKGLQLTIEFESQLSKRFSQQVKNDDATPTFTFEKSISSVFEPYLGLYIEAEDGALAGMIEGYKTSDHQLELDASTVVLPSSTDLFYFYRETLVQSAKLSTGKAFFDLCNLFGKHLDNYCANVLLGNLPRDDKKPMESEQIRFACFILNTADYCGITTLQLEEKLRDKIDDEWKDKVDLQAQRDNYLNAASVSIGALIKAALGQFAPAYQSMMKVSWGLLETVGDQSTYVSDIQASLVNSVTILGKTIGTKRYFRTFCDRFVEAFIPRHLASIARCRPISEVGAEQMLLDTHALKTTIMDMPFMGTEGSVAVPASFAKIVNRGFNKIETILKTIMTPPDPTDGFIESYIFLVADKSTSNFQKIMDLKGVRKPEQAQLMEAFQKRISSNSENLIESSDTLAKLDLPAANALPNSISTSFNTIAATASNFNTTQFQQLGIRGSGGPSASSNSPISPPTDGTTKGRLNENFRKLVMTGMNFRKDLQERRESATSNRQPKPT